MLGGGSGEDDTLGVGDGDAYVTLGDALGDSDGAARDGEGDTLALAAGDGTVPELELTLGDAAALASPLDCDTLGDDAGDGTPPLRLVEADNDGEPPPSCDGDAVRETEALGDTEGVEPATLALELAVMLVLALKLSLARTDSASAEHSSASAPPRDARPRERGAGGMAPARAAAKHARRLRTRAARNTAHARSTGRGRRAGCRGCPLAVIVSCTHPCVIFECNRRRGARCSASQLFRTSHETRTNAHTHALAPEHAIRAKQCTPQPHGGTIFGATRGVRIDRERDDASRRHCHCALPRDFFPRGWHGWARVRRRVRG